MPTAAFIDFGLYGELIGRLIIQLDTDHAPNASQAFLNLCTGWNGKPIGYKMSLVNLISGPSIVSGDFDGQAGRSVYGDSFPRDAERAIEHTGTVTLIDNTCKFCIHMSAGKNNEQQKGQVIGRVIEGQAVLNKLMAILTDKSVPADAVAIIQCGQMY